MIGKSGRATDHTGAGSDTFRKHARERHRLDLAAGLQTSAELIGKGQIQNKSQNLRPGVETSGRQTNPERKTGRKYSGSQSNKKNRQEVAAQRA